MIIEAEWLQKHTVQQFSKKCIQTNRKRRYYPVMTQNTLPPQQRTSSRGEWKVLDRASQSPDINPMEHAFHLLKRKLKGETP